MRCRNLSNRISITREDTSESGRLTIPNRNSEPSICREQSLLGINENIILDQELGALTSVDTIANVVVDVVEEVTLSETEGWATGVQVLEEVVEVGDTDGGVLGSVTV